VAKSTTSPSAFKGLVRLGDPHPQTFSSAGLSNNRAHDSRDARYRSSDRLCSVDL